MEGALRLATEDALSERVLRRLIFSVDPRLEVANAQVVYGGFGGLRQNIQKFHAASRFLPHVVLTDLDRIACPPQLIRTWNVPQRTSRFVFCVAVREVEAWLLGDGEGIKRYFSIRGSAVISNPELLDDPKLTLLGWLRRGPRSRVDGTWLERNGNLVPGPMYNLHLGRFVTEAWSLETAAAQCPSLLRARDRVSTLANALWRA